MALGSSKSEKAWPALRKALDCEFLCGLAFDELASGGDMSMVPRISEWLASKEAGKQGLALAAIVSLSTDRTRKELAEKLLGQVKPLLDQSGAVKQGAAKALASLGDDTGLPVLHELAVDESEYLRGVEQLEHSPDPWRGRHSPTNYTQREALDAIARLASPKSLPILRKLQEEAKDERIRNKAAKIIVETRWRDDATEKPR
jgi:HEAT repeat protein